MAIEDSTPKGSKGETGAKAVSVGAGTTAIVAALANLPAMLQYKDALVMMAPIAGPTATGVFIVLAGLWRRHELRRSRRERRARLDEFLAGPYSDEAKAIAKQEFEEQELRDFRELLNAPHSLPSKIEPR